MDVTSLNLIEKAEYQRPKSFAKEGIRDITCFASPLGRLYIVCELTDYSCIWYSNTKTGEPVITEAILEVLKNTTKESNREWYCSTLSKVLEATNTSWKTLHSFYPIRLKVTRDGFFYESEKYSIIHTAAESSEMISREVTMADAKANDSNLAGIVLELKSYIRDFEALLAITDNYTFLHKYNSTVNEKRKRIDSFAFLIFSKDSEAISSYQFAKKLGDDVYNKHMSLAR